MADSLFSVLIPIAITQTGALIFFAGVVAFTLKNHGERLTKNEAIQLDLLKAFYELKGKENQP